MKKFIFWLLLAWLNPAFDAHSQNLNEHATLLGRLAPPRGGAYANIWGYAANGREYALLGCYEGTSIIEVTNPSAPVEVAFIRGARSIWREIKTHSQYAYVVHDSNDDNFSNPGLQIIDLSRLPAAATLANTYSANMPDGFAHTLYIDNGVAYLHGTRSNRGANILDLSDPTNPVEVGGWAQNYWHDSVVKNDTIYGAAMFSGYFEIVDARDKSNLMLISRTFYPNAFAHNLWMTDDNKYISQTDEIHDLPVNFWDVSDHTAPKLVATYHGGPGSIGHNTHIRGNYAYISYYYDGLKVIDISQRRAPVEVANYDTYPDDNLQRGTSYEGAWGAYPFLPSGNVLVSDITYGLNVIKFDGTRAGFISGAIKNKNIESPIGDVKIELLNRFAGEGSTTVKVEVDGKYVFGAKPGTRSFKFSRFGYDDYLLPNLNIQSGLVQSQDILLNPKPSAQVIISARTKTNQPIVNARIIITSGDYREEHVTDGNGNAAISLPYETYDLVLSQWGFLQKTETRSFSTTGPIQVTLISEPGYIETFTDAQPWLLREPPDQSIYDWVIEQAVNQPYPGRLPSSDHTGDTEGYVAISRARFGSSTFTSPTMDASLLDNPYLQFARYYNPYNWASEQANDTLQVLISNNGGSSWKLIDAYTSIDTDWQVLTYRLVDYVTPTTDMKLRFVNVEGLDASIRASAFLMIDDIKLISEGTLVSVHETPPLPRGLELLGNYPNPFNPSTTIRWRQAAAGIATISLFNLLGQKIADFKTAEASAGERRFVLELDGQAAGVYFYQLSVNGAVSETKKLLLLR